MGTNLGRQADDFLFAVFTGISSNDQPVLYVNCELRPHGGDSSTGRRGRDRTCNHRFRKPVLYPIELRARNELPGFSRPAKDNAGLNEKSLIDASRNVCVGTAALDCPSSEARLPALHKAVLAQLLSC